MNTRKAARALFYSLLLASAAGAASQPPSPAETSTRRELTIVVVETLERGPGRITDFDRISSVFTEVFSRRKWPVDIKVERFAANTAAHDAELRIFYRGIFDEAPGELTFDAWMTLSDRGTKWDFGVVRFRYNPRPFQQADDVLERVVRGAAEIAATKVESVLFPKTGAKKP